MTDIDVDALMEEDEAISTKSMCYKTVNVFAGITQRKLWLKEVGRRGVPCTDGAMILVPFDHPRVYQYTEHEISHILFQSDARAKATFVQGYSEVIERVANKANKPVDVRVLRGAINAIVGILDDERVISLWGLLYRGSEAIMRRMKRDEAEPHLAQAHEGLVGLLYVLAAGHDVPAGKLDRFRPYMREALRKVRHRDFYGTLVTAKWLIAMMVSEVIRQSQGEPPIPDPGPGFGDEEGPQGLKLGPEGGQDGSEGGEGPSMPWEGDEPPAASEGSSGTGQGQKVWQPPDVQASPDTRTSAMQALTVQLGKPPKGVEKVLDDVLESKFRGPRAQALSERAARKAIEASVKDGVKLEQTLDTSTTTMQRIVDKARQAVRNVLEEDDRIRQDAYAKVTFHDVDLSPMQDVHINLSSEDEETVQRLRALFFRVMGRRTNTLEEDGVEIDIPAYIERRQTGEPIPVFRTSRFGRGFKTLLLVDRSSSMEGHRTEQAERGCKIIARALDFPFVDTTIWGFQSWKDGEVDITRFDKGLDSFETAHAIVGGRTPLHTAVRVAVKHLDSGSEKKHLFVLSDGFPVYTRKDGAMFGTGTLMSFVRSNVMYARSRGIGVTGVMIGKDTHAKGMAYMFGPSKYWRVMSDQSFRADLVQLTTQSFIEYLQSR